MIELDETRPKWRQVADIIQARIKEGVYPLGTRIPSVVKITEEFGVASITAQKVMRSLREDGIIRTETGMGSYVIQKPPT